MDSQYSKLSGDIGGSSRKIVLGLTIVAVLLIVVCVVVAVAVVIKNKSVNHPPHVIIMISDGMGPAVVGLTRMVLNHSLYLDSYLAGATITFPDPSFGELVTDSAAAATTYACGLKTYNAAIGVDSQERPCGTLLEAAQAKGWKTALVVTSRLTHATPAGFSAHVIDRDDESHIAAHQVAHKIDIMLGGGARFFNPLMANITQMGYNVVNSSADLQKLPLKLPVFGAFTPSHMDYMIDRTASTNLPSLSQMVDAALQTLKNEPFFMLIEGSRTDHALHNNDAAAAYQEAAEFDKTAKVVMDWAAKHKNTFVLATADHDTGGLSLDRGNADNSYPLYTWYPDQVRLVKASTEAIRKNAAAVGNATDPAVVTQAIANVAYTLNATELQYLTQQLAISALITDVGDRNYAIEGTIGRTLSMRAGLGWSTVGHSGVDVPLYVWGDRADDWLKMRAFSHDNLHTGALDNTNVALGIAKLYGLDLAKATTMAREKYPPPPVSKRHSDRRRSAHPHYHEN